MVLAKTRVYHGGPCDDLSFGWPHKNSYFYFGYGSPRGLPDAEEVKPKYAEAHFNLGLVYFAIGEREEAIKEYDALVLLDKALAKRLKGLIGN